MKRYGKIRSKLEDLLFEAIPGLGLGELETIAPAYKSPKMYGATSMSWKAYAHIKDENGVKREVCLMSPFTMGFLVKHGAIEYEEEEWDEVWIWPKGAKEACELNTKNTQD